MFNYRHIPNIDETTLRIFCYGTGLTSPEMYAFGRAYAMLQLKHWIDGYRNFPENKEFRKRCMSSFIFNVQMMVKHKRGRRF